MAEKLLDRMRGVIQAKHYSYRAEQAYVQWAKRFIPFHGKRHPYEMGKQEIEVLSRILRCDGKWLRPHRTRH